MINLWLTLLGGPAVLWWNSEISPVERGNYRAGGIYALLDALTSRFRSDATMATMRFTDGQLTLIEIASDEHRPPVHPNQDPLLQNYGNSHVRQPQLARCHDPNLGLDGARHQAVPAPPKPHVDSHGLSTARR